MTIQEEAQVAKAKESRNKYVQKRGRYRDEPNE